MATRGPKPTPLKLVEARGNPGKRKPRKDIAPPPAGLGEVTAPAHLCAEAREEWTRVAHVLGTLKMLTQLDRATLAAHCEAYGQWVIASRAIAEAAKTDPKTRGLVITTSNGNVIQNPLVGIANRARADMMRYAVEFGMTPSSRIRAEDAAAAGAAVDSATSGNPFDAFRRGKA